MDLKEFERLKWMTLYEKKAQEKGYHLIAGVDEAGRGPLAGPVVAAACLLPFDLLIPKVNDSKKLTAKVRAELFDFLTHHPDIRYGIGVIDAAEIDKINIYQATIQAMKKAIEHLSTQPDYLLIDGLELFDFAIKNEKIIKGDQKSQSIAAASIIAKEYRDQLMASYHLQWPVYQFDRHKGYGTLAHRQSIEKYGFCPIHRRSFKLKEQK